LATIATPPLSSTAAKDANIPTPFFQSSAAMSFASNNLSLPYRLETRHAYMSFTLCEAGED
jgi:hypothetical protein